MLKVGCGRFAVARGRYFDTLPTVELGVAFMDPPKLELARGWRAEAPKDFEFSLPASQVVTHMASSSTYDKIRSRIPERRRDFCGHFKDTPEVGLAWERTRALAEALRARFVVFETPASFYPDSNHLRDMYRFFKSAARGTAAFVWQPRGHWEPKLAAKVAADLGLMTAYDPFERPGEPPRGPRYFRLRGEAYSDAQLKQLRRFADGAATYAYFLRPRGWLSAKRMAEGRA
jgi:uncharacterized protein YecE (DUF72 family)